MTKPIHWAKHIDEKKWEYISYFRRLLMKEKNALRMKMLEVSKEKKIKARL